MSINTRKCKIIAYGSKTTNVVQCQPIQINWDASGATAPFFLSIHPGSDPTAAAIQEWDNLQGSSYTWNPVNQAGGTSLSLLLRDSGGNSVQSAPFSVQSSSNSGCLNGSSGGSSGSASGGGASSTGGASASSPASSGGASTPASSAPGSTAAPGSSSAGSSAAHSSAAGTNTASGASGSNTAGSGSSSGNGAGNNVARVGLAGVVAAAIGAALA